MDLDRLINLAKEKSFLMPNGLSREQRREWAKENIMKANEFVKKFGWGEAKFYLGTAREDALWVSFDLPEHGIKDIVIYVSDLKRLVESYELIKSCGGLEQAKAYAIDANACGAFNDERKLKQAIADVESCQ